ncbi:hypothetical protein MJH12_12535 [bacterium]|nr:hypothetical protein [bacterium]
MIINESKLCSELKLTELLGRLVKHGLLLTESDPSISYNRETFFEHASYLDKWEGEENKVHFVGSYLSCSSWLLYCDIHQIFTLTIHEPLKFQIQWHHNLSGPEIKILHVLYIYLLQDHFRASFTDNLNELVQHFCDLPFVRNCTQIMEINVDELIHPNKVFHSTRDKDHMAEDLESNESSYWKLRIVKNKVAFSTADRNLTLTRYTLNNIPNVFKISM